METPVKTSQSPANSAVSTSFSTDGFPGARLLTALDLNNIRLNPNHTVLTPEYLEQIKAKPQ